MKKRFIVLGAAAVVAAAGIVVAMRGGFWTGGAVAQAPRANAPQAVPVEVQVAQKKTVPVRIEALGTVTPIASVAVKPRVDTEITDVHFRDGGMVKKGDLLFTLDSRAIEAQAKQIEGQLAAVKVGNFVRQADISPLATIIQTAPVYVTFALPQVYLPDLRQALTNETATVEAVVPGDPRRADGQVTMIENSVDAPTGTVPVRATMPNGDELLWPGTLVTVRLTFREEEAVVVPSTAVQVSQTGTYVFLVNNDVATVRPVQVARVLGSDSVLASGLEGGETIVTNGQLLLSNGSKVAARVPKVGS